MENNNDKYYTPSIEEFHVGFECELMNYFKNWDPAIVKIDTVTYGEDDVQSMLVVSQNSRELVSEVSTDVRVPYLNRSGVERLGWEHSNREYYGFQGRYTLGDRAVFPQIVMEIFELASGTQIEIFHLESEHGNRERWFLGFLKSKGQLKQLMGFLNIQKSEK